MSRLAQPLVQREGFEEDYSCGFISSGEDFVADVERALFLKSDYSDVTFVVEGERFHAHKMILSIRCEYFKAMLYGGLKESTEAEIELKGADAVAFRAVLQYIYSVQVDLSNFNIEELFSILRLAHEYRLVKFQEGIIDYLKKIMNVDIVFTIAETSALLSVDSLVDACKRFCDQHAVEVLKSKGFLTLPLAKVMEMLSRDSFYAPEIDIFHALTEWTRAEVDLKVVQPELLLNLFKYFASRNSLRLHLISYTDLLTVVRRSTLFASNSGELDKWILDAMEVKEKGTGSTRRQSY